MNCNEAKRMIQAWALGELGSADSKALEVHGVECPLCRSEIARIRMLESELANLQQPGPPSESEANILAAVARLDDLESPLSMERNPSQQAPVRDSLGWTFLTAGGAFFLATYLYELFRGEVALNLAGSRIGGLEGLAGSVPLEPLTGVYLAGMFLVLLGGALLQRSAGTESRSVTQGST